MIEPLAITTGFFPTLEKHLGKEPIAKLDKYGMDMKDPGSFLACYDLGDNPKEALRCNSNILKHYMLSFCGTVSLDTLIILSTKTDLQIIKDNRPRFEFFIIITGTVLQLYEACKTLCVKDTEIDLLKDLNTIILTLERSELREIFKRHTKVYLDDNTFYLE